MDTRRRLLLPDALRGIGLLGIAICNAPVFALPYAVALSPAPPTLGAPLPDGAIWFLTMAVCEHRFLALFAMLFGASLLMVGGKRDEPARGALLDRRLAWLALFGAIHGALLWWGDILLPYAVAGILAARCRSWPARALIVRGALWFLAGTLLLQIVDNGTGAASPSMPNFARWSSIVGGEMLAALLMCAPLMLIGMGLYKNGVLTGAAPPRTSRRMTMIGLSALAILCTGYGWAYHSQTGSRAIEVASIVAAPLIAIAYAGILSSGIACSSLAKRCAEAIAPAGRMALTNYVGQSLLFSIAFHGQPAAIGRPAVLGTALLLWVIQLMASRLWLSRFSHGPIEATWRRLYQRPQDHRHDGFIRCAIPPSRSC
jgi:uncharacterized protein